METISVELRYLVYVAILCAVLWVPYMLAHIMQVGVVKALSYPTPAEMPDWARRVKGAHYNLVENLVPFTAAVAAGEALNVHTGTTAACAMAFFWARLLHPFAMASNIWGTRTTLFFIGSVATIIYLFAILTAATA